MSNYYNIKNLPSGTLRIKMTSRKSPFIKVCRDPVEKTIYFEECSGYLYELQDSKNYKFKVALYWDGRSWRATHFNTGLEFTPYETTSGGFRKPYRWNKEALIEALKKFDVKRLEEKKLTILELIELHTFTNDLIKRIAEIMKNEQIHEKPTDSTDTP